jgi:hypothetical protein
MWDKQHCPFDNDFVKAAVFLDTRYNIMFNEEEISEKVEIVIC